MSHLDDLGKRLDAVIARSRETHRRYEALCERIETNRTLDTEGGATMMREWFIGRDGDVVKVYVDMSNNAENAVGGTLVAARDDFLVLDVPMNDGTPTPPTHQFVIPWSRVIMIAIQSEAE